MDPRRDDIPAHPGSSNTSAQVLPPQRPDRPIRVYDSFDARFLMEDFFAKLAQFARRPQTTDSAGM